MERNFGIRAKVDFVSRSLHAASVDILDPHAVFAVVVRILRLVSRNLREERSPKKQVLTQSCVGRVVDSCCCS